VLTCEASVWVQFVSSDQVPRSDNKWRITIILLGRWGSRVWEDYKPTPPQNPARRRIHWYPLLFAPFLNCRTLVSHRRCSTGYCPESYPRRLQDFWCHKYHFRGTFLQSCRCFRSRKCWNETTSQTCPVKRTTTIFWKDCECPDEWRDRQCERDCDCEFTKWSWITSTCSISRCIHRWKGLSLRCRLLRLDYA